VYIGHQTADLAEHSPTRLAQLGVEHPVVDAIDGTGIENEHGTWNAPAIRELRARLARFGMAMDVLALGLDLRNTPGRFPGVVRGGPSRDAEIALLQQRIRAAGEDGVPCLKYNFIHLGVLRTGPASGRGGARYSHFDLAKWTDHSLTDAGPVPAERSWDNIAYLLERIVPVAEESGVRLTCHPHDPPGLRRGSAGSSACSAAWRGSRVSCRSRRAPSTG
jgi:mannonate dehydratase